MAFNKNEYWQKKQERKQVSEVRFGVNFLKALTHLKNLFTKTEIEHEEKRHTRSPKERKVRRAKHADRLRTIRAL